MCSVKNRLSSDSGISFTEFSYQLLQAYDFHHLHQAHGCTVQLGGSDQWGNIVAGIDLIKSLGKSNEQPSQSGSKSKLKNAQEEKEKEAEAYGVTIPLLTTSNGEKFGKSAGNAVWLDEQRTGISDFYQVCYFIHRSRLLGTRLIRPILVIRADTQFFLRSTDEDVGKYLRLFTLLPLERIDEIMLEHGVSLSYALPGPLPLCPSSTRLTHVRRPSSRLASCRYLHLLPLIDQADGRNRVDRV
jgi:tyrosyl-tRNA synthetase